MFYKIITLTLIILFVYLLYDKPNRSIKSYTSEFYIPKKKYKNFYNPSVIKYNNNIITFHRECSAKHNLDNLIKILTGHVFVSTIYYTYNNNITKLQIPLVETIPKYKKIVAKDILIKGYEDPRAVVIEDKIILVCSVRANSSKYYQVCIIKIDANKLLTSPKVLKIEYDDVILLHPCDNSKRHQKNWSPFVYKDKLHLVYSINPQIIYSCNTNTGQVDKILEKTYKNIPMNKMRGGSNLIPWIHPELGNVLITIVHGKIKWFYYHLFYICKQEFPFTILGISDNFIFKDNRIEFIDIKNPLHLYNVQFASTLITMNDKLLVGYGEGDCKSKKCIIKVQDVNKIIKIL